MLPADGTPNQRLLHIVLLKSRCGFQFLFVTRLGHGDALTAVAFSFGPNISVDVGRETHYTVEGRQLFSEALNLMRTYIP